MHPKRSGIQQHKLSSRPRNTRTTNLEGNIYGRLTVLNFSGYYQNLATFLCKCSCGNEVILLAKSLKSGNSQSCGCFHRDSQCEAVTTHGHRSLNSRTYITWLNMKQRCLNPNNTKYYMYGGVGITVCERWLKFENFLEDMGKRPLGKSIDRIENSKGYYKENCRWATHKEQCENRGCRFDHS